MQIHFPKSYLQLLQSFNKFLVYDLQDGKEMEFYSSTKLFSKLNTKFGQWQIMDYFNDESNGNFSRTIISRDSDIQNTNLQTFKSFTFGAFEGERIFFNLNDFSVWSYWLDEGSIGKIANTFDDFMQNSTFIEKDN